MNATRKRAAAYVRMSTERQDKSPERQRQQIEALASQKNYEIVQWYEDQGMRGWDTSRPAYQDLLRDARAGHFEVIVADELSRLTRLNTLNFFSQFAAPLSEAGIVVDTVSDGVLSWDDEDLGGAIMQLLRSHKGFSESLNLGQRTTKGLFKLAQKGQLFVGPRPLGLEYSVDSKGKRTGYIRGPAEEVATVELMFERYAGGKSLADIAEELNRRGILTRRERPWTRNSVHNILTNSAYAGDYVFGKVARGRFYRIAKNNPQGHVRRRRNTRNTKHDIQRNPHDDTFVLRDKHDALIDRRLFDQVQALLKKNQKHTSPSRAKGKHPLSGLLFCPACGHVMYGTTRKCKRPQSVYVCGRYMKNRDCEGYFVREDEAIASISQALTEKLTDPCELKRLESSLLMHRARQSNNSETQVAQLRQKVTRLDAQISQATARLSRIPDHLFDSYLAEIGQMESERADTQLRLSKVNGTMNAPFDLPSLVEKVQRLADVLIAADSDVVHRLLSAIIERVDLTIRVIPLNKNNRYIWEEGNIHLRQSEDLSEIGPGRR